MNSRFDHEQHKRKRKRDPFYTYLVFAMAALLIAGGTAYRYLYTTLGSAVPVFGSTYSTPSRAVSLPFRFLPSFMSILEAGVPGFAVITQKSTTDRSAEPFSAGQGARRALALLTDIDLSDARSLLQREIPLLVGKNQETALASGSVGPSPIPILDFHFSAAEGKPLVGIYHTHTSESFIPTSGSSHSPGGQRGDIVQVGATLKKYLEQNGIATVQSLNVHDYPSFMKAYNVSEITLQKMIADAPSLQMVFDIHRDAEKREHVTAVVNGVTAARILIVVAVGRPDLVQPHWQQNQAFAQLIEARLNEKYPGLCRGIELVDWRYNQHLHPRALLFEVGCQENSLEEAQHSMEMLGDVLTQIIREGANKSG